MIMVNL